MTSLAGPLGPESLQKSVCQTLDRCTGVVHGQGEVDILCASMSVQIDHFWPIYFFTKSALDGLIYIAHDRLKSFGVGLYGARLSYSQLNIWLVAGGCATVLDYAMAY